MKDDKQNDRQGVAPPDKDMREAFEEALPFIGGTIHVFSPTRTARDERYLEGVTEVCWRTWQAAFSRASSSRAEVETYRHKFTGEVREFDAMDDASDSWVPVAVDKSELKRLHDIANEYDACVRHMDAGGDFHEFQAKLLAAAEAPIGDQS